MLFVYRTKLWIRHLLRWIFKGATPAWASDTWDVLDKFAFLKLIPTILAIGLVPEHFFSRIGLITSQRQSGIKDAIHPTPVNFVFQVVTLVLAATWFSRYIPGLHLTKPFLLVLLVAYPVVMMLVSLAFLASIAAVLWFGTLVPLLDHLIQLLTTRRLRKRIELFTSSMFIFLFVPLAPSIYRNLNWKKMGWSVLYLYGYFISVPMFILLPIGVVLWPLAKEGSAGVIRHPGHFLHVLMDGLGSGIVGDSIVLLLPIAFLIRLSVYPYGQALLMCLKRPTGLARMFEMEPFADADRLLSDKLALFEMYQGKRRWQILLNRASRESLIKELRRYQKTWMRFNGRWLRYMTRFHIKHHEAEDEFRLLSSQCRSFGSFGLSLVGVEIAQEHVEQLKMQRALPQTNVFKRSGLRFRRFLDRWRRQPKRSK